MCELNSGTRNYYNQYTLHIPPIFNIGVDNFHGLYMELIYLVGVENLYCKSTAGRSKIHTINSEFYIKLIYFLSKENVELHKNNLKGDKPTLVVILNLHSSMSTDLIKSKLETRLFKVRQVTQVLHRLYKNSLLLFFVDLETTPHLKEIIQSKQIFSNT